MLDPPDLYQIPLPPRKRIYLTADQLLEANRESTRLGFNRLLDETRMQDKICGQKFISIIKVAQRHVGWNGAEFDNENIRIIFYTPFAGVDSSHIMSILDITLDTWQNILENQPSDDDPGGVLEANGL